MKKWRGVASVMCVVVITIVGCLLWNDKQNKLLKVEYGERSYGTKLTSVSEQVEAQMTRQKVLDKAISLRKKWRVWAKDHRVVLKNMMQSPPVTRQDMHILEQSLPRPGYAPDGIQWSDLGPMNNSPSVMLKRDTIAFTWQVPNKKQDDKVEGDWQLSRISQHSDYPLMISIGGAVAGRETVTVWASGRITEEVLQKNKQPGKGKPVWGEPKINVIQQSYDFLNSYAVR